MAILKKIIAKLPKKNKSVSPLANESQPPHDEKDITTIPSDDVQSSVKESSSNPQECRIEIDTQANRPSKISALFNKLLPKRNNSSSSELEELKDIHKSNNSKIKELEANIAKLKQELQMWRMITGSAIFASLAMAAFLL